MSLIELVPSASPNRAAAWRSPPARPAFPKVAPGQIWLIEVPVSETLTGLTRHVLGRVNVVIYDRALSELVAETLPLGGYAELATTVSEDADPALERAVRFARDGWSVARLVPAEPTQRDRVLRARRLAEELAASEATVILCGELSDGVCEPAETRLNRLDQVVVTYPRDARLTIVVSGVAGHIAPRLAAIAGNGLAG